MFLLHDFLFFFIADTWTKKHYKSLLALQTTDQLGTTEQDQEKNKAFDLLDALTKSGRLSLGKL